MKKCIILTTALLLSTVCFTQGVKEKLSIVNRLKIERILTKHYSFHKMSYKFSDGLEQTFFRENSKENLKSFLFVYIEYSDSAKNIKSGIKVLMIDTNSRRYKEYSEFRYLDYEKEGLSPANGGLTNNGFGWLSEGYQPKMDRIINSILKIFK